MFCKDLNGFQQPDTSLPDAKTYEIMVPSIPAISKRLAFILKKT
jgi:hypothetical protein